MRDASEDGDARSDHEEEISSENMAESTPTVVAADVTVQRRNPVRRRQPPAWMSDYTA